MTQGVSDRPWQADVRAVETKQFIRDIKRITCRKFTALFFPFSTGSRFGLLFEHYYKPTDFLPATELKRRPKTELFTSLLPR
ncbi:hypothetical protein ACFLYG_03055 [Chloroflexota bacterium]